VNHITGYGLHAETGISLFATMSGVHLFSCSMDDKSCFAGDKATVA
jgi:hypothetical protein